MSLKHRVEGTTLCIDLVGKIDSVNAPEIEDELNQLVREARPTTIVFDCAALEYLSSAGLRVLLRAKKSTPDVRMVNVSSAIYEIFDMTGFVELFSITKAYRVVSIDGCEVIGRGAYGTVYRIGPDTIVKVFRSPDALPEITRERELARAAFIAGIPTAIPYDVVRVGEYYGSVYELLNAKVFSELLASGEKSEEEIAVLLADLLKQIHTTKASLAIMTDKRDEALEWARFAAPHLPGDLGQKLLSLVGSIPQDRYLVHGDYHLKNVMLQDGESLLIDMDTLGYGHPVIELAMMYNAYVGYGESDERITSDFLGVPYDVAGRLWDLQLKRYFDGADDETIRANAEKAMILGGTRVMRRCLTHPELDNETGQRLFAIHRDRLVRLLPHIDSLAF